MDSGIFLIQTGGELVEMKQQPYDSEALLQQFLARYPSLLAGDQMNAAAPRKWLLISREMGVPSDEDGADRWSLDHLFLDQDAVPTLIEVKRSSDTRIRREVVGQMLDYAANAVVYWPVEAIRARFEEGRRGDGADAAKELATLLGPEGNTEEFWQRVKTNLQAGRIRMVFVADDVPPELRRIVEFLNGQMDPAEVLAVEIKQFVGEFAGQGLRTLVPRVIGQTTEAERKKGGPASAEKHWDESSFFEELRQSRGEKDVEPARTVLDWAKRSVSRIWWGKGSTYGSFYAMLDYKGAKHFVVSVWTYGRVEIPFQWMLTRQPFESDAKRLELRERLTRIPGVAISADAITRRPTIPLAVLTDDAILEQFLSVLDWYLAEVKAT
jgi:hypothetical protein